MSSGAAAGIYGSRRLSSLKSIFRHKVFKILLSKGKITEDLARYIVRASFSQERMTYVPEEAKVVYESKDRKQEKIFDALEWIAAMCSHIPSVLER